MLNVVCKSSYNGNNGPTAVRLLFMLPHLDPGLYALSVVSGIDLHELVHSLTLRVLGV